MLTRQYGYLWANPQQDDVSSAAKTLETEGGCVLRAAFTLAEVDELRRAIDQVFSDYAPDQRGPSRTAAADSEFRYEMLNRSLACLAAVAKPEILAAIEPLLGEDCHIIANTAWRNQPKPNDASQAWHVDGGPHIPLPKGTAWPSHLPHPVFAIGCHILLQNCTLADGPTGFVPGSHRSGRPPPGRQLFDPALTFEDRGGVALTGQAGDVLLFVSDVWHRRMPTGPTDQGRYFLQVHYGRRDIQQRLRTTSDHHQLSASVLARLEHEDSQRLRQLVGQHEPGFYDG